MFNFKRFKLLLDRRFALEGREMMVGLLVMTGIALALFGGFLTLAYLDGNIAQGGIVDFFRSIQRQLFGSFVAISASIFASKSFSEYGDKHSATAHLMLPATRFEKLLAPFLTSTYIFLVMVMASFYVAQLVNIAFHNAVRPLHIPYSEANGIFEPGLFWEATGTALCIQAVYFLGSIHFKKDHWWNTTLVLMVAATVFGLVQWIFSEAIKPVDVKIDEFGGQFFAEVKGDGTYLLPVAPFWGSLKTALFWLIPPVFWCLSFLKLSEKEV